MTLKMEAMVFDFYPGLTIDPLKGLIIFLKAEPFGKHLFNKLDLSSLSENYDLVSTYNSNQAKYVFRSLYKTTQGQSTAGECKE